MLPQACSPVLRPWIKRNCVPRGAGGLGFSSPPPPKFRRHSKIVRNSTRLWKLLKIAEFRAPTSQDVRKKGSKILKLPPVRNCFTLAMTNKLVVIINSLKVPKIKKVLLYEMKFLVPNYSCLQNPSLAGYRPQIPVLSVLNWIWTPPPRTKFLGTPLKVVVRVKSEGYRRRSVSCQSYYTAEFGYSSTSRRPAVESPGYQGYTLTQFYLRKLSTWNGVRNLDIWISHGGIINTCVRARARD